MHDYDILNLIRSKEIREYFRKNWKMNIEQKLSLVARSYVDISVKIEYLRHLAEQCDQKDRSLVLDMIKYMELGYRSILISRKNHTHNCREALCTKRFGDFQAMCIKILYTWNKNGEKLDVARVFKFCVYKTPGG